MQGQAKGLQREGESISALAKLGVDPQDIIFLGYPDTHLGDIWTASNDTQIFSSFDGTIKATYGNNGFGGKDLHSLILGSARPYSPQAFFANIEAIVRALPPSDIGTKQRN